MITSKDFKQLLFVSLLKTIWFNFRYFSFRQAYKMPVFLAKKVQVRCCYRGFCVFVGECKTGALRIGFGDRQFNPDANSSIAIKGKLILKGDGVHALGPGTILNIGKEGVLTLGNGFTASARNNISCNCAIIVGDDNMWSYENVIMDSDAHQICEENNDTINLNKPIVFGDHVWLGCRNIVLKGSKIADGCMIASGSIISGEYTEPNCIITTGKKTIKQNIHWKRDWAKNNNL